jgi:WD40 repeat protein
VRAQIWNEEECVGTLKAHTGVVSALAFDQDWLYSSSWDGFVKVFFILSFCLNSARVGTFKRC